MASRALGATLALGAALLLMASLLSPKITTAVPAWWSGAPTVAGQESTEKTVYVGPLGAMGCDQRGCQSLEVEGDAQLVGYAATATIAAATFLSVLLSMALWRLADARK